MNFETEPKLIKSNQNFLMKIAFVDQNKKQKINQVTVRMDISKDGKHILGEFFHAHDDSINVDFKQSRGSTARQVLT